MLIAYQAEPNIRTRLRSDNETGSFGGESKVPIAKSRIEWVDIGKYICIMFVIISHLESVTPVLTAFYSPFFLTLFFFLSGYVYKQPKSFEEHLKKKFRGLFVPWLIFSHLNIILSMLITLKGERNIPQEFVLNLLQIRGIGDGIWFVAALFVAFIPFFYVNQIKKTSTRLFTFGVIAVIEELYIYFFPADFWPWGSPALPWHLEYIGYAMFWMALGYCFKTEWEKTFDDKNTVRNRFCISLLYLAMIIVPLFFEQNVITVLLSYITSIVGIIFIISYCKVLKTNWYISFVGANTLIYFALHGKVFAVIEKVLQVLASSLYSYCLGNIFLSSVLAIIVGFLTSVILIVPAYIINRWFPWMIGRSAAR